ncbi:kunitz-type serine protease inhibitor 2-like [Musca domestica]|uniref:Kunitz-type serine protease inhibitor 2-like n=1 Tax=Musca domestica TaxID=7370 RepID=A0ABM3UUR7_MUSDO|nr:kunitz-type serine protease inhibitor 2-like [Musca domestica]
MMKIFVFFLIAAAGLIYISSAANIDICQLEHSADGFNGTACLAYFPCYSYNVETDECVQFIYGGCGGNANRFDTLEECTGTCKR